jgi:hypothetical protein
MGVALEQSACLGRLRGMPVNPGRSRRRGVSKPLHRDRAVAVRLRLRKQASPAEIEAATFDQKTIFTQVDKTCGKLRPSSKP